MQKMWCAWFITCIGLIMSILKYFMCVHVMTHIEQHGLKIDTVFYLQLFLTANKVVLVPKDRIYHSIASTSSLIYFPFKHPKDKAFFFYTRCKSKMIYSSCLRTKQWITWWGVSERFINEGLPANFYCSSEIDKLFLPRQRKSYFESTNFFFHQYVSFQYSKFDLLNLYAKFFRVIHMHFHRF